MTEPITCGEATVRLLAEYGVDTVFGIPGVHTLDFFRGFTDLPIRHVLPPVGGEDLKKSYVHGSSASLKQRLTGSDSISPRSAPGTGIFFPDIHAIRPYTTGHEQR